MNNAANAGAIFLTLGRILFGLGLAGLGALGLIYDDFALQWQPVPDWIPNRSALAYVSGAILLLAGASLLARKTAWVGALALVPMLLLWSLLLHVPRVAAGITAAWLGMFEILALSGGAAVIVGALATAQASRFAELATAVGRSAFAISLPVFGAAHFVYAEFTAAMVPAWLPARLFWAYFTGAGHVAAGLSIISNILPRWGATLLAIMFTAFATLVNLARAIELGARVEWTGFCIATALTGAAWAVAGSLFTTKVNSHRAVEP